MTNFIYDNGKNSFLKGEIAFLTDIIKVALVSGSYSPHTNDKYWSSVMASVVGSPQILNNKAIVDGTTFADNTVFPLVTGELVHFVAIYKDTGNVNTSPLIGLIDTADGLPILPNNEDITIVW
jgi:hypothetical protein